MRNSSMGELGLESELMLGSGLRVKDMARVRKVFNYGVFSVNTI